jgi:misacylated tRNA(Ala) deacylase
MTLPLYRDDAYRDTCEAKVVSVTERRGIVLDQTIFYPTGGGQPGDKGAFVLPDGTTIEVAATITDRESGQLLHLPSEDATLPAVGDTLTCHLDMDLRLAHMRCHTTLHLLCALIPFSVTGGQIGPDKGRLDFDIPDTQLDKDDLSTRLNALIGDDRAITSSWITDDELTANPDLVRTMSVKPPMGSGRIRMITIANCDFQPCGGTHVRSTGEIGTAPVTKIEKKGAQNRRVRVVIG